METMLKRDEAAEALSLSVKTLDRLIKDGRLQAVRIGRRVAVPTSSLEAYIADIQGSKKEKSHE